MPLSGGRCVPIQHNVAYAKVYIPTKWHLDPSSPLAATDMGRKLGGLWQFLGELGPHLAQLPGPKPTSIPSGILIHPVVWPQQTWAAVRGMLCPLFREAGSPSNTMLPGPRPTSVPSYILIHPVLWPQQMWAENWGELGSHLTQCGLGRGLPPGQVAS